MSERIIVTGATGFAGSHVLEYAREDARFIASCRDASKLPERNAHHAVEGDLRDEAFVARLAQQADVICHAAAWAELNGSVEDSRRNFLEPTLRLIDAAVRHGVKRFVFLSSVTSKPIEERRLHTSLPLEKIWAHYDAMMRIEAKLKEVSDRMQVVIVRAGFFTGKRYALGILPILLPRLKTHLVPYIEGGKTSMPLINGIDVAQALVLASTVPLEGGCHVVDAVGKEVPTVKEVLRHLHEVYGYPMPHFSVPFGFAYLFARAMRALHRVLPFDPLIVPSVVLLLEETHANNDKAEALLGYKPKVGWKESIAMQIEEMNTRQHTPMRMNK